MHGKLIADCANENERPKTEKNMLGSGGEVENEYIKKANLRREFMPGMRSEVRNGPGMAEKVRDGTEKGAEMSKDKCCKGCARFYPPYMDAEGKMRTCRQGCTDWDSHEKERRETYDERMRRIRGAVGISPEREKSRQKITMMIKQGRGR